MSNLQQILLTQLSAIQQLIGGQSVIMKSLSSEPSLLSDKTKKLFCEMETHNTKLNELVGECGKLLAHID